VLVLILRSARAAAVPQRTNARARVSKDEDCTSCFETHRSAAELRTHSNSLGCDAPQHEGAGGRTNLRLQETIAGSVSLFPACSLQGMPQLQRVEP